MFDDNKSVFNKLNVIYFTVSKLNSMYNSLKEKSPFKPRIKKDGKCNLCDKICWT